MFVSVVNSQTWDSTGDVGNCIVKVKPGLVTKSMLTETVVLKVTVWVVDILETTCSAFLMYSLVKSVTAIWLVTPACTIGTTEAEFAAVTIGNCSILWFAIII